MVAVPPIAAVPGKRSHRPPRALVAWLSVAALLLPVVAPGAVAGVVRQDAGAADAGFAVYIDAGPEGRPRFTRIDPTTLADVADGPDPGRCPSPFSCALSADGSTLVALERGGAASAAGATVVVHDGLTGGERVRFRAPDEACCPVVSRDGARLVLFRSVMGEDQGVQPRVWYALDVAAGRPLGEARTAGGAWEQVVVDPEAGRLYRLAVAGPLAAAAPRAVGLNVHDLTSGAEVGRLELPDVRAGRWRTGRTVQAEPVMAEFAPGLALSPDGRRLAIVHADGDAVTLVDAERLAVERTLPLSRPVGLGSRLVGWLGLAPRSALAKEPAEGVWLQAVYGSDGRSMYVWGIESTVDDADGWDYRGIGLRRIDLETGEVAADVLPRAQVHAVQPAPDGRSVYVVAYDERRSAKAGVDQFPLFRLDAATLDPLAERIFPSPRWVLLQPEATAGST